MKLFCMVGAHRWKPCMRWLEPPKASSPEEAMAMAIFCPGLVTTVLAGRWKPQWIKEGHKCVDCGKRRSK